MGIKTKSSPSTSYDDILLPGSDIQSLNDSCWKLQEKTIVINVLLTSCPQAYDKQDVGSNGLLVSSYLALFKDLEQAG